MTWNHNSPEIVMFVTEVLSQKLKLRICDAELDVNVPKLKLGVFS